MLIKSPIKSAQELTNMREVLLADQEPKLVGSVLRERFAASLHGNIVESQF